MAGTESSVAMSSEHIRKYKHSVTHLQIRTVINAQMYKVLRPGLYLYSYPSKPCTSNYLQHGSLGKRAEADMISDLDLFFLLPLGK